MRYPARLTSRALIIGSALVCTSAMMAQDDTTEATDTDDQDIVYLSPFEVTSEGSIGYQARDTLAGTRLRTDLKDVANAVQVVNSQFLQDTGATDSKSLLVYTTNTEVGGIGGNFANIGTSSTPEDTDNRVSPQTNTRVRGLTSADNTRNFYLTRTPWDSYNVDRVDIQRGANSLLFGIGSPAGIVNTNVQGAVLYNEGKIETKIGSYGTIRGSVNVNQVLLDGQLAVRVAGLYEHEYYQQKPAFEKDKRIYVAVRYDPKWLQIGSSKFSLKMNAESGDIEANRPRATPPLDHITQWYTMGQPTYENNYARMTDDDSANIIDSSDITTGVLSSTSSNYNAWVQWGGGLDYSSLAARYDTDGNIIDLITGVSLTTSAGSLSSDTYPDDYNLYMLGIVGYSDYATTMGLPGSDIAAYKDSTLTDSSVFNFYKKLLDGDNKRELESWNTFNMTLSETFFDDMFGIELGYDYQNDTQTYKTFLSDYGYAINVDMAEYLSDGSVNDYAGYAYVASRSTGYSNQEMRNTVRATGFFDLDLKKYVDPDSWLVRVFGRQVFQSNYTHMVVNNKVRGWMGLTAGSDYGSGVSISEGNRYVATLRYIGDLNGTTSASGLNLSNIQGTSVPSSTMNVSLFNTSTESYEDKSISVWSETRSEDKSNLYISSSCYDTKTVTDTWGVIWNGYMFDNCIVPTIGYREDKQKYFSSGNADLNSSDGIANFDDPDWYVPSSSSDARSDVNDTTHGNRRYLSTTGHSTSWGIVAHLPEFIKKKLPWGMDFSVFYNKSDNFSPDANRIDMEGSPLDPMTGETKDYGFAISALDNRISLKVNWYHTTVDNASMSDAISGAYMLGMGEAWTYRAYLEALYHLNASQDFSNNYNGADVDYDGDGTADWLPWYPVGYATTDVTAVTNALAQWNAFVTAFTDEDNQPSEAFQRTWMGGMSFAEYDDLVSSAAAGDRADAIETLSTSQPDGLTVTGQTESKGIEFELNAQITNNWNVALNVAKTTAVRNSIADTYADFVEARRYIYSELVTTLSTGYELSGAYGYGRLWWGSPEEDGEAINSSNTLYGYWVSEFYGNYLTQRALLGADVPELCKWRFNLVTNYSFDSGILKGFNVGGGYRWQDHTVIGYPLKYTTEDGEMVLDTDENGYSQFDIDRPYYGDYTNDIDFWVGYQRQLNDKVTWRIQLNIKNLFQQNELTPVATSPADKDGDGIYETCTPSIYSIKNEATYYLTNTFTF